MVHIKTYMLNHFYQQYLVLLTMAPRNSKTGKIRSLWSQNTETGRSKIASRWENTNKYLVRKCVLRYVLPIRRRIKKKKYQVRNTSINSAQVCTTWPPPNNGMKCIEPPNCHNNAEKSGPMGNASELLLLSMNGAWTPTTQPPNIHYCFWKSHRRVHQDFQQLSNISKDTHGNTTVRVRNFFAEEYAINLGRWHAGHWKLSGGFPDLVILLLLCFPSDVLIVLL